MVVLCLYALDDELAVVSFIHNFSSLLLCNVCEMWLWVGKWITPVRTFQSKNPFGIGLVLAQTNPKVGVGSTWLC